MNRTATSQAAHVTAGQRGCKPRWERAAFDRSGGSRDPGLPIRSLFVRLMAAVRLRAGGWVARKPSPPKPHTPLGGMGGNDFTAGGC